MATAMHLRRLSVVDPETIELEFVTDDGDARVFDFHVQNHALADETPLQTMGPDSAFAPYMAVPHSGWPIEGDPGWPAQADQKDLISLVISASRLARLQLPVDDELRRVLETRGRKAEGPQRDSSANDPTAPRPRRRRRDTP